VASGTFPDARAWWWELRLHRHLGTIEFRVPDGQTTVADAAAVAAVAQALTAWLARRHAAGERLAVAPDWRIDENRWSACRHGTFGEMADLQTGEQRPTQALLEELLEALHPVGEALGSDDDLAHAGEMIARNGAVAQREVAGRAGIAAVPRWLAARFLEPWLG
jgi:carboxylate-amine ligase